MAFPSYVLPTPPPIFLPMAKINEEQNALQSLSIRPPLLPKGDGTFPNNPKPHVLRHKGSKGRLGSRPAHFVLLTRGT